MELLLHINTYVLTEWRVLTIEALSAQASPFLHQKLFPFHTKTRRIITASQRCVFASVDISALRVAREEQYFSSPLVFTRGMCALVAGFNAEGCRWRITRDARSGLRERASERRGATRRDARPRRPDTRRRARVARNGRRIAYRSPR